jgi:hypothetical protein
MGRRTRGKGAEFVVGILPSPECEAGRLRGIEPCELHSLRDALGRSSEAEVIEQPEDINRYWAVTGSVILLKKAIGGRPNEYLKLMFWAPRYPEQKSRSAKPEGQR